MAKNDADTALPGLTDVLEELGDAVAIFDAQDRLLYGNSPFRRLFGPVLGRLGDLAPFEDLMQAATEHGISADAELLGDELETAEGNHYRVHQGRVAAGHLVRCFRDVTEFQLIQDQVAHLASHDDVTGLPNRMLMTDRLGVAMEQAKRESCLASVFFIDLDGFKEVNDRRGHDAGDILLQQVSARLVTCVRATDTVARYGGDEFVLVLTQVKDAKDVIRVAEAVLGELTRPFSIKRETVLISGSIGISLYPDHAENAADLVKMADQAMYEVKHHGKCGFKVYEAT